METVAFASAAKEIGLDLSSAQIEAFAHFEANLYEANQVMNLTRVPREECATRHFLDSLLIETLIPAESTVLDIGSGPGFPAWPLACARPDLRVTALDSSGKMLGFLRKQPLANLAVFEGRAEEWGVREAFDFVTGRAVAPLSIFLELAAAPCRVGGEVVPMRTPLELEGFAAAAEPYRELLYKGFVEKPLPGTDIVRAFPIYRKLNATAPNFPRRWAEMKKSPGRPSGT